MKLRASPPRLLPLTIVVMAMLLSAKVATFAGEAKSAIDGTPSATVPASPHSQPQQVAIKEPATPADAASARAGVVKSVATAEVTPAERALLEDLRARREQLDEREQVLDERKVVMEAAEAKLETRIGQLSSLQGNLEQLDGARKQRQGANWTGLVKVYEAMKPRDAAAIFDVLDIHVMLEVLDRMNERKAAAVLAAMQPERARMATQMLAQMRTREDAPDPVTLSAAIN